MILFEGGQEMKWLTSLQVYCGKPASRILHLMTPSCPPAITASRHIFRWIIPPPHHVLENIVTLLAISITGWDVTLFISRKYFYDPAISLASSLVILYEVPKISVIQSDIRATAENRLRSTDVPALPASLILESRRHMVLLSPWANQWHH